MPAARSLTSSRSPAPPRDPQADILDAGSHCGTAPPPGCDVNRLRHPREAEVDDSTSTRRIIPPRLVLVEGVPVPERDTVDDDRRLAPQARSAGTTFP